MEPYVGVTGIIAANELRYLEQLLDELDWPSSRYRVMNGILLSQRSLSGQEASNPRRYPPLGRIPSLLSRDPRIINVIHYNSRDPRVEEQLRAIGRISPLIKAVQLNIPWPNPLELGRYHRVHQPLELILQISRQAFDQIGDDPEALAYRLQDYRGCLAAVLLDPSSGGGLGYNPPVMAKFLAALRGQSFHAGVAGGLSAETIPAQLVPLRQECGAINWDAEGRLRDEDDHLDPQKLRGYLEASRRLV